MCLFLLVKVHSLEKQIETITKVSDSGVVNESAKKGNDCRANDKTNG